MHLSDQLQNAINQRWGDLGSCPYRSDVIAIDANLQRLKPQLKEWREAKQLCAKEFGKVKKAGGDITALKERMQSISDQLDQLEQERKRLEAELDNLVSEEPVSTPLLPARFIPAPSLPSHTPFTIREATDTDAQRWDDFVFGHPRASLYHSYRWREVITRSFAHQSFYYIATDATGHVQGILPIIRLRSRLFGDFGVSMPFFNYGGALSHSVDITTALLAYAVQEAKQCGLKHLEIRSTQPVADWPARTDKVSMILRLPDSEEGLAAQIGTKVRAQIKRAQQEPTETRIASKELLDDFYRVFAINMRDLGTPVYARGFFENILDMWPAQARLIVVYLRGKPVAGAFLLGDREMLEIPWASTLRKANPLNINMLLYWEVLKFAIAQRYSFFDFGRSTRDAGTFRFKKQWGAEPLQHYWHYWLADGGALPELKPDSPKFRFAIACWQRLPVFLTRWIGPPIVKNLP